MLSTSFFVISSPIFPEEDNPEWFVYIRDGHLSFFLQLTLVIRILLFIFKTAW